MLDTGTQTLTKVVPTGTYELSLDTPSICPVPPAQNLVVSASYAGKTATQTLAIEMVGTQVVYPLSGFAGKTVKADLWDETAQTWRALGEAVAPDELVIEEMVPGQWYWLRIKEYDAASGSWVKVQNNWISM